ncbi:hypothetical protein [Chryseobacterium sp. JM1]|uniref:hypothetical protein n=1 Tax=Chryseobacterium sp. JM1 TaxID=1233950 RepID=UPI000A7FE20B|nr:hypothetical protein [Chryseobacterium sp. JM1]
MKNLKKLNRNLLKEFLGGHTCPGTTIHLQYNGYHVCCIRMPPGGNPCKGTLCLIEEGTCSGDPM